MDGPTRLAVMTREFPDELLSAFLDDELSPAERDQVEKHLAASPADRQLLQELKSLKCDMANLPAAAVQPDFAERVLRAAVAEAEKHNSAQGVVSQAPPAQVRHFQRSWQLTALAAALAACLLLFVQPWRPRDTQPPAGPPIVHTAPPVAPPAALPEQFLGALTAAYPGEREAVVLRLRINKHVPIAAAFDAALAKANIATLVSDRFGAAALLQDAYQRSLPGKRGNASGVAAEAVFIEAPLERLQGALAELATTINDPLTLEADGKLALSPAWDDNRAEGESAQLAFVQHLNASGFRLIRGPTAAQAGISQPLPTPIKPQQRVRVLILVETE